LHQKSDIKDGALLKLFDYLAWAMNALLMGRYPERDWGRGIMQMLGNPCGPVAINSLATS
jgi:hypothetical protein